MRESAILKYDVFSRTLKQFAGAHYPYHYSWRLAPAVLGLLVLCWRLCACSLVSPPPPWLLKVVYGLMVVSLVLSSMAPVSAARSENSAPRSTTTLSRRSSESETVKIPHLRAEMEATPDTLAVGESATVFIRIHNRSDFAINGLILAVTLPPELSLSTIPPSFQYDAATRLLTHQLALAGRGTFSAQIPVRVDDFGGKGHVRIKTDVMAPIDWGEVVEPVSDLQAPEGSVAHAEVALWDANYAPSSTLTTDDGNEFVPEVMPSIRGIQSDLFTGSASIRYEIAAPPGAGGLTPSVALTFNSKSGFEDPGNSSVVGAGWKLSVDSFRYYTPYDPNSDNPITWRIDGIAGTEKVVTENSPFLIELPTWRIHFDPDEKPEIFSPEGVKYHFEPALFDWWCEESSKNFHQRTDKWVLESVEDRKGNQIEYVYDTALPVVAGDVNANPGAYSGRTRDIYLVTPCSNDGAGGGETVHYLSQINLVQIRYNEGQTVIDFEYDDRQDGPILRGKDYDDDSTWYFFTTKLLKGIKVRHGGELTAAYKLSYDYFDATEYRDRRYALRSIERCSDEEMTQCLPATVYENTYHPYSDNNDGTKDPAYVTLRQADNGYGGQVGFAYANLGNNNRPVQSRTITDTVTGRVDVWHYEYDNEYSDWGSSSIAGFGQVTETLPISLGGGATIYHEYEDGTGLDSGRRGKETLTEVRDGGVLQQQTLSQWTTFTTDVYGGAHFVGLTQRTRKVYDNYGSSPVSQRTVYAYDRPQQGDAQYGNVTDVETYGTDDALYRRLYREYYPQDDTANGRYVVNKMAEEKLYDGAGTCQDQRRMVYDQASGYAAYDTPPSAGYVHEVWRAGEGLPAGGGCNNGWVRQKLLGYDSYGNLTSQTASNGAVTSTVYDDLFHAYPVSESVTPGAGGGATLTTSYRYYGVNAASGGRGLTGQLQEVEDANGAITRYSYDAWGRPTALRRPNASFADPPTETYAYVDAVPFEVKHGLRDDEYADDDPNATYLYDWTYYDGLGQVIETQKEGNAPDERIVVWQRYNALGAVVEASVPYTITSSNDGYQPPDTSQPTTVTEYDSLGRTTVVTAPSGARVRMFYKVGQTGDGERRLLTAVLDEKDHQTIQRKDVFGRLRRVDQYEGTYSDVDWKATRYASARYEYDVRDNLTDVDHPGMDSTLDSDIHTHITYDAWGRKIELSDPDMGDWAYEYDASGNLIRQTDARGVTLCYEYDGHNRLRYVREDPDATPDCAWGNLVWQATHTYDEGANGKGRRTGLESRNGGTSAWVYDPRGRVTSETRTLGGVEYVTRYDYDSADRVRKQTYPDDEEVVFDYDDRGLLERMRGEQTYISDATYDAAMRLHTWLLGLGVTSTYEYYDWDAPQGGRLQRMWTPGWQDLRYDYDAVGNVTRIEDGMASQTQDFGYDALNRLQSANVSGGGPGQYSEAYDYAPNGNLAHKGDGAYAYDAAHPHAAKRYLGQRYCYDANGNATTRLAGGELFRLSYDVWNHLSQVARVDAVPASILRVGVDAHLSWSAVSGASAYEVWRSASPYFSPGDAGSEQIATTADTSYTDANHVGDPATNYYYQIVAMEGDCPVGVSERLGEFDFGLVAGALLASIRSPQSAIRNSSFARPEAGPLAPVTLGETTIAEYFYDGDGNRVKAVVNGETTYYPGRHYETTAGSGTTKYYFANDGLVAFRRSGYPRNNGLRYVFRDHLGSTSVIANGGGTKLWEDRYKAFGDFRYTWIGGDGRIPVQTDYRYTGQRYDATVGLYDYRARWYDPTLARFIQPDTIVPNPGDPQSLNRYSYAANNPISFTDPTGYYSQDEIQEYLRNQYGDNWQMYWDAWQYDPLWMQVLYAAEDGNILLVTQNGQVIAYQFGASDNGFTFGLANAGEVPLHLAQGQGVYLLSDGKTVQTFGPSEGTTWTMNQRILADNRYEYWAPVYDYSSGIPKWTGEWNVTRYQTGPVRFEFSFGVVDDVFVGGAGIATDIVIGSTGAGTIWAGIAFEKALSDSLVADLKLKEQKTILDPWVACVNAGAGAICGGPLSGWRDPVIRVPISFYGQ